MTTDPAAELCCPRCRARLIGRPSALQCCGCGAVYPIVAGIPDLRVCEDPYLDREGDREKAAMLASHATGSDFGGLLRRYWEMTPATPLPAAERYMRYALRGEARGRSTLGMLGRRSGRLLDLGAGTGGVLAAGGAFRDPIGVDVALRWLVIARKRLEERRANAFLVCACADHLPFPDGGFDAVVGLDLLAHCADPRSVFAEAARVQRPAGQSLFTVANRYSLLGDPHTGLVGTGFLPRPWQPRYVVRRNRRFDPRIRPLGAAEAAGMARRCFRSVEIALPRIDPAERDLLSEPDRRKATVYERLRHVPIARGLLLTFGPAFSLLCAAPISGASA